MDTTRVDRWLCAVRVHKTRSISTAACEGGHVDINGKTAKPAAAVHVGDTVTIRMDGYVRVLEVVQIIDKRVGPAIAATCIVDHSPPREPRERLMPVFVRDPGAGRPTKRDRRSLDRLRG